MIWFFILSSLVFLFIGIMLLAAPQKLLFLMPEVEQQRLMEGRAYRIVASIGGFLMIFACAPLSLLTGFLFVGLWSLQ